MEWPALYSHGSGRALNQEEIPMEQGSLGDKILVGFLVWFLLGEWVLFLAVVLPLLPLLLPFIIIWFVFSE